MAISRRAFGIGLLAASAAGDRRLVSICASIPRSPAGSARPKRLFGFRRRREGRLSRQRARPQSCWNAVSASILDARRAGSVEMVRGAHAARPEAAVPVALLVGAGRASRAPRASRFRATR